MFYFVVSIKKDTFRQMTDLKPLFIYLVLGTSLLLYNSAIAQDSLFFNEEEKAWIESHPVIQFGYEPDWPPYEIYQDGKYTGIIGEYVSIIERETGIDLVPIEGISWSESIEKLRKGEIHFIPDCAITIDRKKEFLFSSVIATDPLILATRIDDHLTTDLASLSKRKVAIPEDYYTIEFLSRDYPGIEIIKKPTLEECMESLTIGEVDGVIDGLGVISYCINHKGYTNIKIACQTEYREVELAMAFSKDWVVFRNIVNKVLKSINAEEHNAIRKKWIAVRYDLRKSENTIPGYIIIGGVIILIVIIFLVFWNRTLRKHILKREAIEKQLQESVITISRQSDERKVLLQEIHHRVKNNLQIVVSLLKLQGVSNDENNEQFDVYHSIDRIQAIALIHEKIYQSENLNHTNVTEYITSLTQTLVENYSVVKFIDFELKIESLEMDIEHLVPLGIILNELITNSIKHAFVGMDKGQIKISLSKGNDLVKLKYRDNGKWIASAKTVSFGESLIEIFTEQLGGICDLSIVNGTEYSFSFPYKIKSH